MTGALLHPLAICAYGLATLLALLGLFRPAWPLRLPVRLLLLAGIVAQLGQLFARWQAEGHFPVTGLFETLHFLALWVAGITLYFDLRYRARGFVPAGTGLALLALAGASFGPEKLFPLTPALDTPLFFIHVATSFAAYGLWSAAALLAPYDLMTADPGRTATWRRMQDETLYLGYILFTWCMLAGSLWAYLSWGSYWTWRIKGLWSYLLWFYYSGVLHVRKNPRWQGAPTDFLALAGFVLVLFAYLGLGLLFKTSHPLR